jgi:hypothetical protein
MKEGKGCGEAEGYRDKCEKDASGVNGEAHDFPLVLSR